MIDSNIAKIDLICSYPKTDREFIEIVEQATRRMLARRVAITDIWMSEELAFWAANTFITLSMQKSLTQYVLENVPEVQEIKGKRGDPKQPMMIFFNREGIGIGEKNEGYQVLYNSKPSFLTRPSLLRGEAIISKVIYPSHIFIVELIKNETQANSTQNNSPCS